MQWEKREATQVRLDDAQGDKEKTKRLKVVADQTQPDVQTVEAAAQPLVTMIIIGWNCWGLKTAGQLKFLPN